MPTATQITVTRPDLTGACRLALFCSGLQPSDAPTAGTVATAISRAVQQFGIGGCAGRMAQEFRDHPDVGARNCHRATRRTTACILEMPRNCEEEVAL